MDLWRPDPSTSARPHTRTRRWAALSGPARHRRRAVAGLRLARSGGRRRTYTRSRVVGARGARQLSKRDRFFYSKRPGNGVIERQRGRGLLGAEFGVQVSSAGVIRVGSSASMSPSDWALGSSVNRVRSATGLPQRSLEAPSRPPPRPAPKQRLHAGSDGRWARSIPRPPHRLADRQDAPGAVYWSGMGPARRGCGIERIGLRSDYALSRQCLIC